MPKHGRPSSRSRDDFMFNNPIAAPYGTLFTQPLNVKIIGGKFVPVSNSKMNHEFENAATYRSSAGPLTNRTDIQQNSSSIKEKEEVLKQTGPINPHRILPAIGNSPITDLGGTLLGQPVDIGDLYNKLPRDVLVSVEPFMLTEDEEIAVMREIKRELQYFDYSLLNIVLSDLQRLDRNSTGYLPFQDLQLVLSKNRILLPPRLLRLLGCIFVSRIEQGVINYYRLLNFVSEALKGVGSHSHEHSRENKERNQHQAMLETNFSGDGVKAQNDSRYNPTTPPLYYQTNTENWRQSPSPRSPRGEAHRTLRYLQDRLPHTVNVERLRLAFQRADRYHRGTLSESQIREISAECLNLDREIVDSLIVHVPARGGGQYNWQSFIDLLERVQPIPTGLRIPESKRPLEYARSIPQPAASWPEPDTPQVHNPDRFLTENPYSFTESSRILPHAQPQDAFPPLYHREDTFRSDDLNTYPAAQNKPNSSGVIPPMETKYPNPVDIASEPWHNRFMKYVDAIYRQDQNCSGFVDEEILRLLTREYNSTSHLNISDGSIADALSRNRKSSGINVHGFLMSLANVH